MEDRENREDRIKLQDVAPEAPDVEMLVLTEEEEDVFFARAAEVNFLVDSMSYAMMQMDTNLVALVTSSIFSFAFKLGVEYANRNKKEE